MAQNSNTRSDNSSSSTAIGAYADTSGSGGITASASRGKGYANSDSVTYANTQVNVGGTTTFDIANDVNGKGVVFNTNKVQGVIGGNVNMESPQDTYTYDSNQKSMGFSADIDIAGGGAGSSLSVNGAKTNINADSKMVGQQTGLFANEADLIVEGKGNFKGAVFTTSEEAQANGKSNIVFKQGVTATDIINTTSYEGDAISVGVSVGKIKDKPQATMNGLGYGTDGDSNSSITKGGVSGYNDPQGILTTENREALAGKLESVFDEQRVTEELGAQVDITKEFGKEAPKAVGDFAVNRQLALIEQGKVDEADKWAEGGAYRVALHTLVGAIATGSVEGALASGTTAVSIPAVGRYLDDQGVDETTKGALLLGLSAGIGATVGGDTAGAASSVNQTQNNYLNHIEHEILNELRAKKERMTGKGNIRLCNRSAECRAELADINKDIKIYEDLSADRDAEFNAAYNNCLKGTGCNKFYDLHVTQRIRWNESADKLFKSERQKWTAVSDDENAFHNYDANGKLSYLPGGKLRYKKYVHDNGQLEIVVDSLQNNKVVYDPKNAGSYNYYSSVKGTPATSTVGHIDYDVDPYIDFGSGKGDTTTISQRREIPVSRTLPYVKVSTTAGKLFGELQDPNNFPGWNQKNMVQLENDKAILKYKEAEGNARK
nr:filamentous hemagglutinin family outer membrane protein [Psychrobacter sp.]QJS05354.1 filamentous hemagglutinin family outer membrane protein, adhesin HecA family [Psychrobacter sp.]QJS05435.1 filamentous hemagglutinin family outer membrane protein [Psychrobacter sp.]